MTLKRDSYFTLSKGERRATLWLIVVLAILIAARLVQQYLPSTEVPPGSPTEYEAFQDELKEFGSSLRQEEPKRTKSRPTATRQPRQPKSLDPVPREE